MLERQLVIPFPLTKYQLQSISSSISLPRFNTYLKAAGFDVTAAINLYRWNAFVGECLHFPLQATEITLRNAVSTSLKTLYGQDWFKNDSFTSILNHERTEDLRVALTRLNRRAKGFSCDDVTAALSFGFWAYMLEPRYYQAVWRSELRRAFPGLPKGRALKSVHLRAKDVREVRNRVAHHEPLIGRDLSRDHTDMLEFLTWLCPEKADWAARQSYVQSAIRQRPQIVKASSDGKCKA
jgi:hypothetical protein